MRMRPFNSCFAYMHESSSKKINIVENGRTVCILINTKGASPRWAAARLGSAHARNFRGCMINLMSVGLQVNRVSTCDSTANGYSTNNC